MVFLQESEYIYIYVFDLLKEQVQKRNIPNYYTNNRLLSVQFIKLQQKIYLVLNKKQFLFPALTQNRIYSYIRVAEKCSNSMF